VAELLEAALAYAARGWPVHPCRPGTKVPMTRWRQAATTDPDMIRRWWGQVPMANVAIATGTPALDVVDVDRHGTVDGSIAFGRLRDAGLVRGAFMVNVTPTGGWHIGFAGTAQGNGSIPKRGIDFRGLGGYVLAPPSVVDGRPYVLADHREPTGATVNWTAIRDYLEPPRMRDASRIRRDPPTGDHTHLVAWLEQRPAGDRNQALLWACCRALEAGADDRALDELRDAIVRAGHDPRDAQGTVNSARKRAAVNR